MSLTNTSSIVNDQLRNLIERVNDKINNFETLFSLIRTMADEQTLYKSENAELKVLMVEVKSSLANHHKQYHKRNTTIDKLQDKMIQKDKKMGI